LGIPEKYIHLVAVGGGGEIIAVRGEGDFVDGFTVSAQGERGGFGGAFCEDEGGEGEGEEKSRGGGEEKEFLTHDGVMCFILSG